MMGWVIKPILGYQRECGGRAKGCQSAETTIAFWNVPIPKRILGHDSAATWPAFVLCQLDRELSPRISCLAEAVLLTIGTCALCLKESPDTDPNDRGGNYDYRKFPHIAQHR